MIAKKFTPMALIATIVISSNAYAYNCEMYDGFEGRKMGIYNETEAYVLDRKTGEKDYNIENYPRFDFLRLAKQLLKTDKNFFKMYYPNVISPKFCGSVVLRTNPFGSIKLKDLNLNLMNQVFGFGSHITVYGDKLVVNSSEYSYLDEFLNDEQKKAEAALKMKRSSKTNSPNEKKQLEIIEIKDN